MRGMSLHGWSADELGSRARACLASGRLPTTRTTTIIAGYGSGESRCDLCGESIVAAEVESRARDPRDPDQELALHFACHFVWQLQCGTQLPLA
jgi:hypothetical protein